MRWRRRSGLYLVALGFLGTTLVAQERPPSSDPQFRVRVETVLLEVRVVDRRGAPALGLVAGDFRVEEQGQEREITFFEERSGQPLSLAVLLDLSGGMRREAVSTAKEFATDLIHRLEPQDEILLGIYASEPEFLSPLTADRYLLLQAIDNISSQGLSSRVRLGDRTTAQGAALGIDFQASDGNTGYAVDRALHELKRAQHANKVVLVISAAFGNIGPATLDHLEAARARLFAVSFGDRLGTLVSLGIDQAWRRRIVRRTAGSTYPGADILDRLEELRNNLKTFYMLAFKPVSEDEDDAPDRIRVRIEECPDCRVSFTRRN